MDELELRDLYISVEGKEIVKGVSLTVKHGETHAIMGPNGSGKSTLSNAIMGHPKYKIEKGDILLNGQSIKDLAPDRRASLGVFLAFQYPQEIPGVSLAYFLRSAYNSTHENGKKISVMDFHKMLQEKMKLLKMDPAFGDRYLNEGFSGGEKKRSEILQLAMLQPKFAILDETDSGLDIDALRIVAEGINAVSAKVGLGILLVTHYQRILRYIRPDHVHVMVGGKIVRSGGHALALELEEKGYEWLTDKKGKE
ncbi:MAG TPA: Fe-S cluster assembly ATPase SufC [Candidatus Norongarragalinales archaeon]|nr:Fe-S cluster assembly ATPase SufC [Candidatus Norongarragalinales archaeon]